MKKTESNQQQTLDLMVGVIPTLILYGNFIFVGLFFGIKEIIHLNNPFDEIFIISLGGLIGLFGLVFSLGNYPKKIYVITTAILIIVGIVTACYVIFSLYTEPDSPDRFLEKVIIFPLFGSIIVGLRRLYLCTLKL